MLKKVAEGASWAVHYHASNFADMYKWVWFRFFVAVKQIAVLQVPSNHIDEFLVL